MRVRIEGRLERLEQTVTEYVARFARGENHPAVVVSITEREFLALQEYVGRALRLTWYPDTPGAIIDIFEEPWGECPSCGGDEYLQPCPVCGART